MLKEAGADDFSGRREPGGNRKSSFPAGERHLAVENLVFHPEDGSCQLHAGLNIGRTPNWQKSQASPPVFSNVASEKDHRRTESLSCTGHHRFAVRRTCVATGSTEETVGEEVVPMATPLRRMTNPLWPMHQLDLPTTSGRSGAQKRPFHCRAGRWQREMPRSARRSRAGRGNLSISRRRKLWATSNLRFGQEKRGCAAGRCARTS